MPVDTEQSFRLHPELRRLVDLLSVGWTFNPRHDGSGEIERLVGLRAWPEGVADAIRVRSQTDVSSLRMDHTGATLWKLNGTLVEVVDGLLILPAPSDPLAPKLVRGHTPKLWTPS